MILQDYVNLIEDLGLRDDIEFTDFGIECLNILYSKILDKCIFEQLFADRLLNGINKLELFGRITAIAIYRILKSIRG